MQSSKTPIIFFALGFLFFCVSVYLFINQDFSEKVKPDVPLVQTKENNILSIPYNYPENLSGKTKEEIFDIRKEYVSKSIFADENYTPSEEVFGQIESGKPWMSLNICKEKGEPNNTFGPSEEGRFIYNPSVLVALDHPFIFYSSQKEWCTSDLNNLIPKEVSYNKTTREITVVYSALPFKTSKDFYDFNGVNARDFGYNFIFLDLSKSTFAPEFLNRENISNSIWEFQNFIHLGGSCGVEGGCNNGSPAQPMLFFGNTGYNSDGKNGIIYLKLWKERPASPQDVPDIAEKIILEKY